MRVVGLFRVSTEKQANEGASLDAQEYRYHELASANGWTTVAEFRGCESATQAATERRVLQDLLVFIREQSPDALYVHEQSRLTRGDELDVATLFRELREQQIKIIIGGVIRDLASIDERFMMGIQSLVDRAESDRFKERTRRGKRQRAREGKKNSGPAPFGYSRDARHGTLQVVPEEAPVVRQIFEMACSGTPTRRIGRALTEQGYRPRRGRTWGKTTVRRILDNPVYIGIHATNVWVAQNGSRYFKLELGNPEAIIVENAHEPIVERQLWDAVHARPKAPRSHEPRMLTGLLWVDDLQYSGDSTTHGFFYRSKRGVSGHPWLETALTDAAVWSAFVSLASSPELVAGMIEKAKSLYDTQKIPDQIDQLECKRKKLCKRLDRLVDMRSDGEIGREVFENKKAETGTELDQTTDMLGELRQKIASTDSSLANRIVRAVQTLIGDHTKLNKKQKRAILDSIVRRVDVASERSHHKQLRKKTGQYQGTTGPKWEIKHISFQLAIHDENRGRHLDTSSASEVCLERLGIAVDRSTKSLHGIANINREIV